MIGASSISLKDHLHQEDLVGDGVGIRVGTRVAVGSGTGDGVNVRLA